MKAYYKNRALGLNIVNQKGPLTLAGSSPYCVLLQVVSEDKVNFVLFSVYKRITLFLELSEFFMPVSF